MSRVPGFQGFKLPIWLNFTSSLSLDLPTYSFKIIIRKKNTKQFYVSNGANHIGTATEWCDRWLQLWQRYIHFKNWHHGFV